jgi:hypothetical protein
MDRRKINLSVVFAGQGCLQPLPHARALAEATSAASALPERLRGETKTAPFVRATAGIEIVDAREGRPYPWTDDDAG